MHILMLKVKNTKNNFLDQLSMHEQTLNDPWPYLPSSHLYRMQHKDEHKKAQKKFIFDFNNMIIFLKNSTNGDGGKKEKNLNFYTHS